MSGALVVSGRTLMDGRVQKLILRPLEFSWPTANRINLLQMDHFASAFILAEVVRKQNPFADSSPYYNEWSFAPHFSTTSLIALPSGCFQSTRGIENKSLTRSLPPLNNC